jgi:hypothetical protein
LSEPKLNLVFALDRFDQSDGLFGATEILGYVDDLETFGATFLGFGVLEFDRVNSIEKLVTEKLDNGPWVGTLGQNNQQHLLGDEEKSGEIKTLDLKILIERSLTVLKMLLEFWQE